MKKTKIVVPALAVLLLSTAASVSGTVAWFSMNNTVDVKGMTVTTKVSSNLQIADGDAAHAEVNYGDSLQQARSGILEPASTINGQAFYYTVSASGDGQAKTNAEDASQTFKTYSEAAAGEPVNNALNNPNAKKTHYDAAFNNAYQTDPSAINTVSYAYIDYSFYLKAGYSTNDHKLMMTTCEMKYNGGSAYGSITTAWAWRVGMFVTNANEGQSVEDSAVATSGNLKTILDFENSKNQNEANKQVKPAAGTTLPGSYYTDAACTLQPEAGEADGNTMYYVKGETTGPKAVSGNANTAITAIGEKANAAAYVDNGSNANSTKRYKVVVRLWLEGEDIS